jgi:hypothetical protein
MQIGQKYHCRIVQQATGKKVVGNRLKTKVYKQGTMIDLTCVNGSSLPNGYIPTFVTNDGYNIPKLSVYPLQLITNTRSQEIAEKRFEDAEVLVNEKPRLSKKEVKLLPSIKEQSKSAVNVGLFGGAVGLVYAFSKGKSKPLYTLVGLVGGMAIGNVFYKKNKK